jgi:hypothetical protein
VLRNNAPRYSHEVRHACFAAADFLEGLVFDPNNPIAVSMPVKNTDGELIGHAQMMLNDSPHELVGISSWFTPVATD